MLKVLDVDGAVTRTVGGWAATGLPWAYDGERYERVARERKREQQAMLDYLATGGCRMEFLRRELDDPAAAACGRCDNCTGQPWPADVPEAGAQAARDRLARPGVSVEPRKMWPTGMKELGIDASGKIPATRTAEPGRALGRLTDVGWGATLRALLAEGAPDEPVTGQLTDAVVKVLAAWDWAQRPVSVVTMPSRSRPLLIGSLGQRIADDRQADLPGRARLRHARRPRSPPAQQRAATGLALARHRRSRRAPRRAQGGRTARSCSSTTRSTPAGR